MIAGRGRLGAGNLQGLAGVEHRGDAGIDLGLGLAVGRVDGVAEFPERQEGGGQVLVTGMIGRNQDALGNLDFTLGGVALVVAQGGASGGIEGRRQRLAARQDILVTDPGVTERHRAREQAVDVFHRGLALGCLVGGIGRIAPGKAERKIARLAEQIVDLLQNRLFCTEAELGIRPVLGVLVDGLGIALGPKQLGGPQGVLFDPVEPLLGRHLVL